MRVESLEGKPRIRRMTGADLFFFVEATDRLIERRKGNEETEAITVDVDNGGRE